VIRIALVVAVMLAACAHPARPNLAASFVLAVEPDARCESFYLDTGEHHTYSTRCRLPTKTVVYCTLADDKGPACQNLSDAPPPKQQTAPAAPSPPDPAPSGSIEPAPPPRAASSPPVRPPTKH
jgi:uncharacterized lipoprotein YbaY